MVASRPEDGDVRTCLAALSGQRGEGVEMIVASAGPARDASAFPWATWIVTPPGATVPRLWGAGMARAGGDVVAFTTAQFQPSPDWLDVIRDGHARLPAAGIGGPIDPPAAGRAFDWAVYFLRYSAYLSYPRETSVRDLAGDNASYKMTALRAVGAAAADEFWEQEAHRALLLRGESLVFVPGMRVRQVGSFPAATFLRQRLRHGRRFGADRAQRHGAAWRAAAIGAAPLIPLVLLGKVVLRVLKAGRHLGPLLLGLPALAACAVAWGMGEVMGYWTAAPEADAGH